jgi:hypothetical protein
MWAHVVHAVTHWPWSTIAAFLAAGGAWGIARAQTNERRALLGREAVVDVNGAAYAWHNEAGMFLSAIRRFLAGKATASALNNDAFVRMSAATATTARSLTSARLACNDFEMLLRIAEAESKLIAFLAPLATVQSDGASMDVQRERLGHIFEGNQQVIRDFGAATDAFVQRGFAVYAARRGIRFRRANRRWDRQVEAAKAAQGSLDAGTG